MAGAVKTRSPYRQEQAAATRARIAEAARHLFATGGYASTSIEAIATVAGVAVRTVYAAFGSKREILSLICERWLQEAQAQERAAAVLAEPDPVRRLRAAAGWLTNLYAAGFDVVLIFDGAMDESPETRALLRAKLAGRNQVMDAMIASLADHLRVPVPEAQAVYRALAAPGVYRELVEESGWTPEKFEQWVGDALERQLLPTTTDVRPRRGQRTAPAARHHDDGPVASTVKRARHEGTRDVSSAVAGVLVIFSLDLVTVPVSDVDRAKAFYAEQVGFSIDQDVQVDESHRFVMLTPPGSACSIALTTGYVDAEPGSLKGVQLDVEDADAAHTFLRDRGVEVSEIQTFPWGRFCFFSDPDGNGWSVHEPPDPMCS